MVVVSIHFVADVEEDVLKAAYADEDWWTTSGFSGPRMRYGLQHMWPGLQLSSCTSQDTTAGKWYVVIRALLFLPDLTVVFDDQIYRNS